MVEEIGPDELHRKFEAGEDVQVVDIRTEEQFREGHVPGAINLPFSEFPQQIETVDWGDDIVCVCPIGRSSLQAARLLEAYEGVDHDARIANLKGGYREYEYELETGDEASVEPR